MKRSIGALALVLASCATAPVQKATPERRSLDSGALGSVYAKYIDAIAREDLSAAKLLVSAGKLENLQTMSDAEALSAIDTVSPKSDIEIFREDINGDDAMLVVRANVADNVSTGRIDFVRESGAWKIVTESWDLGVAPEDETTLLETYAKPGMTDAQRAAIRKLQEHGYAMPSADYLVMAATEGDLAAVKLFVEAGFSPDSAAQGQPAIVAAASSKHPDVVMFLLGAGADVNARDQNNMSALMHLAEDCDQVDVIRALLAAGARRDYVSAGGFTAAQYAGMAQCSEIRRLLEK